MNMADEFTQIRLKNRKYTEKCASSLQRYLHTEGWIDTAIDRELVFSHRNTWYNYETFTEKFHIHEYYELIVYIRGSVEYLNEDTVISPASRMITWFRPGQMHTARLLAPSWYERYVLYFSPDFFHMKDRITPLTEFMLHSAGTHMKLSERTFDELLGILKKADTIAEIDRPYEELVLKSYLIEFFYILNSQQAQIQEGETLTETMSQIKRYIDMNYASITSISEIADQFFYSREHLSRRFKQAFNISIAQYLSRRRIKASLALLETMSVADAAYTAGFHTQSAFISAFKQNMQCLPSEYKARQKQKAGLNTLSSVSRAVSYKP